MPEEKKWWDRVKTSSKEFFVKTSSKEFLSITLIYALFLLFGLFVVWIQNNYYFLDENLMLLFLVFPLIIYLILSGQLEKIRIGNIEAKFRSIKQKQLERPILKHVSEIVLDENDIIKDSQLTALKKEIECLDLQEHVVLKIKKPEREIFARNEKYWKNIFRDVLIRYIQQIDKLFKNFDFIVFVESEKLIGYIHKNDLLKILEEKSPEKKKEKIISKNSENECVGDKNRTFIEFLMRGEFDALLCKYKYKIISINETLEEGENIIKILEFLENWKYDTVIVTDKKRWEIKGIIIKESFLSHLIRSMLD